MYLVYSLVAHPQSAELVQPCQGSLDNPPVHAQPASMYWDLNAELLPADGALLPGLKPLEIDLS